MARTEPRLSRAARLRQKVIEEWRGYREPPHPDRHLHAAGEVARQVLTGMAGADQVAEEEVRAGWGEAVGSFLAAHSEPVSLKRGILKVRVVQPSVRYTLEQGMKAELLARLQSRFGARRIVDLAFTTT